MEKEKKGKNLAAIIALAALVIIILLYLVRCQPGGNADPTEGTTNTTAATNETTGAIGEPTAETTDHTTETTVPSTEATAPSTEPTTPGSDLPTTQPTEPVETEPQPTEHIHSYAKTTTAPSCTAEGYTTYNCECGDSYIDDYTAAADHTWGEWVTTKKPTETATGEAQRKCGACKASETKVLDKVIPDHTHSYSEKVTKAATCTAEGVKTFTCSCGGSYTEAIAKVAHNYRDSVTAPSCTSKGYTVHTCTACGDKYTDSYTEAKGHSYKSVVTAPTCTEGGYTTYTCSVCKDSYKSNTVKATGHSYTSKVTTEATCTKAGVKTYTCSACSDKYTESVPAVGHNYTSKVTAPTCTAEGYTTYTCNRCGDSYKGNYTDAKGHSYTSKVTKAASCTAVGVRTYTCGCGASYTELISMVPHNYKSVVTAPSCTEGGYTYYECSSCGDNYISDKTSATGHKYSVVSSKAPTCTVDGYTKYACSKCSASYTETSPAGHDWNHIHTDEVGHYEWYAICHCGGWKWNVADGDPTASYQAHKAQSGTYDHSYYTKELWIVDTPASDKWVCGGCGEVSLSKP